MEEREVREGKERGKRGKRKKKSSGAKLSLPLKRKKAHIVGLDSR